jgi:hypothetical protein
MGLSIIREIKIRLNEYVVLASVVVDTLMLVI